MVTVKRTVDGYGSNWLCDNIAAGQIIESLSPTGAFTPKDVDRDLLLVGAGSGITPLLSIMKTALLDGSGRVVLFYANRDPESVIFATQLRFLFGEYPERLTVVHWIESVQGLPTHLALRSVLQPYGDFEAFICGPKPFMQGARQALEQIGLPRARIHIENFVSLSDDPFGHHGPPIVTADSVEDKRDAARVTVELHGATHELAWPRSKTLIDVLLAHGVEAPYSCREGECGSCQATVLSGQVEMANAGALDEEDIADGLVLGCQAHPVSDHVAVEFSIVGSDLRLRTGDLAGVFWRWHQGEVHRARNGDVQGGNAGRRISQTSCAHIVVLRPPSGPCPRCPAQRPRGRGACH